MPFKPQHSIQTNWGFTIPYLLFVFLGGYWVSLYEQGSLLRFFAQNRTDALNTFFSYGTQLGEEPIYAMLTLATFFLASPRRALALPLLGFSIMALSHLLKNIFGHKRPAMYYGEQFWPDTDQMAVHFNLIPDVHIHTGTSSFPSGHTMSGFGLFCLLALYLHRKHLWGLLCFALALAIGLSRVYLFQHFLKDVLAGAAVGWLLAHALHYLLLRMERPSHPFWDQPFRLPRKKDSA